jgi:uncharacterized protein
MRCIRCGICCQETDMMLSTADIRRLKNKGFTEEFFIRHDKEGYALLRNRQGYCVFYSDEKKGCAVYASRPTGCRVYPIILDEETGIIVDTICRAQQTIFPKEKDRVGKRVLKLLAKLDAEAQVRQDKQL